MTLKLIEVAAELEHGHSRRYPLAGKCVDVDMESWHRNGEHCDHCGFGIDDFGDGKGYWSEPLLHGCGDPNCIVPKPSPRKRRP